MSYLLSLPSPATGCAPIIVGRERCQLCGAPLAAAEHEVGHEIYRLLGFGEPSSGPEKGKLAGRKEKTVRI